MARGRPRTTTTTTTTVAPQHLVHDSPALLSGAIVTAWRAARRETRGEALRHLVSLWGVALSAVVLGASERVGVRLVAGAAFVVCGGVLIGLNY